MKDVSFIRTDFKHNGTNARPVNQAGKSNDNSFSDRLKGLLEDVNEKQHIADGAAEKVVKGEIGIHEGMISIHEADVSFRYFMKVREKVLQAYNEIRKMPV